MYTKKKNTRKYRIMPTVVHNWVSERKIAYWNQQFGHQIEPETKRRKKQMNRRIQYKNWLSWTTWWNVWSSLYKTNSVQMKWNFFYKYYYYFCFMSFSRIPNYRTKLIIIGEIFLVFFCCCLKTKRKFRFFYFRPPLRVFFRLLFINEIFRWHILLPFESQIHTK